MHALIEFQRSGAFEIQDMELTQKLNLCNLFTKLGHSDLVLWKPIRNSNEVFNLLGSMKIKMWLQKDRCMTDGWTDRWMHQHQKDHCFVIMLCMST